MYLVIRCDNRDIFGACVTSVVNRLNELLPIFTSIVAQIALYDCMRAS
jgi:hypothetical protein